MCTAMATVHTAASAQSCARVSRLPWRCVVMVVVVMAMHTLAARFVMHRTTPAVRGFTRLLTVSDLLVWIDCEMTGLDLTRDALIEVAALVTDADLKVLGDGVDVVIQAEETSLAGMLDVVREMHDRSG